MNIDKDIDKLLRSIKLFNDKVIVFQTDTITTSIFYNIPPLIIAKKFLKKIEKFFKTRTILFPAFSNDIIIKKKFDNKNFHIYTGIIPKLALKSNKYYKTFSYLHGFLVKGNLIKEIKNNKQETTWGKGSVFEWLEKKNARWVAINLNWNRGCAFAHRSEELCKVPYRFYKIFSGKLYKNKKFISKISEKKYSNFRGININFNDEPIFKILEKYSKNFFINRGIFAKSALTKDITKVFCEQLNKDILSRVKNKTYVKSKLKDL